MENASTPKEVGKAALVGLGAGLAGTRQVTHRNVDLRQALCNRDGRIFKVWGGKNRHHAV